MPKAGDAMTEGKVVRWYKQPGDAVKKGEAVAEIETDKVNLDLEAEADGTLGAHAAKEGDMVPVGKSKFIFGYNVHIGLKTEVLPADVLSVYELKEH